MNDRINKEPSLESLRSGLSRDQLQSLLLKLSEQTPSLTTAIQRQVVLLQISPSQPTDLSSKAAPKPHIEVDPKAVRRQVRSIIHSLDRMRSSEAYWQVGAAVGDVRRLVDQAWGLLKADDRNHAPHILQASTAENL